MDSSSYLLGLACGISCGLVIGSGSSHTKTIEKRVEVQARPIEIVQADRNGDGLLDIVQKFLDGSEIVLYARTNQVGEIEYQAE